MIQVPSVARSLYSLALSMVELNKNLTLMRRAQKLHLRHLKGQQRDPFDPRLGGEWIEEGD